MGAEVREKMLRRALIIDTETTGLDVGKHVVIEVAAVVFDLEHMTQVEAYAALLPSETNEAQSINGIPVEALHSNGVEPSVIEHCRERVWDKVREMAHGVDLVLAHSAEFDRSFAQVAMGGACQSVAADRSRRDLPWVCTCEDIDWPKQHRPGMSLVSLALAHGLGVASAHRALDDALLIARLLVRAHELGADLQAMLRRGLRPKVRAVSLAPFDQRDVVKSHGFRWQPEQKKWWRLIAKDDVAALPFKCQIEAL